MRITGFDERAVTYIKDQLSAAGEFGKLALNKTFAPNNIFSLMKSDPGLNQKHDFRSGGIPRESLPTTTDEMAEYLERMFELVPAAALIVEDREMGPGSKFLEGFNFQTIRGQVLLCLGSNSHNRKEIIRYIRHGTSYPLVMGLVAEAGEVDKEISPSALTGWCRHLALLAVGAYDEESFLVHEFPSTKPSA